MGFLALDVWGWITAACGALFAVCWVLDTAREWPRRARASEHVQFALGRGGFLLLIVMSTLPFPERVGDIGALVACVAVLAAMAMGWKADAEPGAEGASQ